MSAENSVPLHTGAVLVEAGLLTWEELRLREERALPGAHSLQRLRRDPYFLSGPDFAEAAGAARWDWDTSKTYLFCAWAQKTLRERFSLPITVEAGPEGARDPDRLWVRYGDREEVCNWKVINRSKWMGAFCIMANRILEPLGVTALELETGGFDTVVCFCKSEYVGRVKEILPVVE